MHRFAFLRPTRLAIVFFVALGAACGGTPTDPFADDDDGTPNPDGLAVGAACTEDAECGGPGTPRCIDGLYPLAALTEDPDLQAIGLTLPGGYCSAEPSCDGAGSCGEGGECFQPLADVTGDVLDSLASALPGIDIQLFAAYGACLVPCDDNAACREGYVCATPIGELLGLVEGARLDTYCIGRDASTGCGICAANSTCDEATSICECAPGYVADGNACVLEGEGGPCAPSPCENGGTCTVVDGAASCSCAGGFTGMNCEIEVTDGCAASPCVHGACASGTEGGYTCDCDAGYDGTNCDALVDCGGLTDPSNGKVATPKGTTYAQSALVACNYGSTLVGEPVRTCTAEAAWTVPAPTCAPTDCGALPDPTNGLVNAPSTTTGATAMYRCANGYVLTGPANRICQADGSWSGAAPSCVDDGCAPSNPCTNGGTCRPDPSTGAAVCTCAAGRSGATCGGLYFCGISGCQNGGTCTSGSCVCPAGYGGGDCGTKVECGFLAEPANGTILYTNGTQLGGTATTACDSGHAIAGTTMRTCQADGTWSGTATTCTPSSCDVGDLVAPEGGSVAAPAGARIGQVAVYACDAGGQLSGSPTRTCQSDLTWSGTAPTCSSIECPALEAPMHGTVATPQGSGFGATATYGCDGDYSVQGAATRTCGADGQWSGAAPSCALTHCRLTYRFSEPNDAGSRFRIQPSAGSTTVNIGPGTMIVRVPRDGGSRPAAGDVELLYYDMDQIFGPVSGVNTETRVCLLAPGTTVAPSVSPNATPPEQDAMAGCIPITNTVPMARGTFALTTDGATMAFGCYDPVPTATSYTPAMATGTAAGCMRTWFGYGRVRCASGEACAFAVSPQDTWLDRTGLWSQHFLAPITLASNFATLRMGNPAGGSTTSDWAHVPNNDNGWTGFALVGTLDTAASTCIP